MLVYQRFGLSSLRYSYLFHRFFPSEGQEQMITTISS